MKNTKVVFLRGKRTVLRPVSMDDVPLLVKWINDPDIREFVKNYLPITEKSEQDRVDSLSKKSTTDVVMIIEVKGKPIGIMGIHKIDWKNRTAVTGALIGEKQYWGKGYGTDAKMAVLEYAFNTLNLRKLMSHVYAFNERSLAYSLHCGYVVEGRLRKQKFARGKYWDEIILGLFKNNWLKYWEKYQKKNS